MCSGCGTAISVTKSKLPSPFFCASYRRSTSRRALSFTTSSMRASACDVNHGLATFHNGND
jgi:hypothetical protein